MTSVALQPLARAERFAEQHRPAIERALAEAIATPSNGVVEGLGWVERVMAEAVGVGGTTGGRRWRPLLVLAGAETLGASAASVRDVAVAVELTHTASLVLDDLPCMDDSATRRGHPATHRVVGTAGAILVAVGLLGRAATLLGRHAPSGAGNAAAWGRAIGLEGMAGGQAVDVAQGGPLRGAKRRLHRQKTTGLSAFALEAAARAAGAPTSAIATLSAYGRDLGWAYQLADDVEDRLEDRLRGRTGSGADPLALCRRLLRRAERRLVREPALQRDGVELLVAFGRSVVPAAAPGSHAWHQ